MSRSHREAMLDGMHRDRSGKRELDPTLSRVDGHAAEPRPSAESAAIARARVEAADSTAEAEQQAVENLKLRFAHENQVPPILVDRLRGATVEELATDWETLSASIPVPPVAIDPNAPRVPAPVRYQGAQPARHITMDDIFYEKIYGRKG